MATHISHAALPYPIKNARYTLLVPYLDADGDPTDPTTPDTEVSQDGGAFADAAEEVTTITGSNGMGYVTLSGAETNNSAVGVAFKVTSGPKATLATLYPRNLPILESGTAGAGAAGSITFASGTYTGLNLAGCFVRTTGGTGGGGTGGANNQARRITSYNTSTRVATVTPNWETTPDATTTYDILMPEGILVPMLTALAPTTLARTLVVDSAGLADANVVKVGPTGSGTAQTAGDIIGDTNDIQARLPAALTADGNIKADALRWAGTAITATSIPVATAAGASGGLLISGSNSGTTTFGALTVTGATTLTGNVAMAAGLTVTQSTADGNGITVTGNGTGSGVKVTGGSTSGHALDLNGAGTSGRGIYVIGTVHGIEVRSGSGATGNAVHIEAFSTDGNGLYVQGTGTGYGLRAIGVGSTKGCLFVGLENSGTTVLTGAVTATSASNDIVGVDIKKISGDATAADNAESFFDGTGYAGTGNTIPTVTTLTGHTAQTGDSYAIVNSGTHGNAALKTLIDTVDNFLDTEVAAILALLDDPRSEPGQGAPPVNPDLATKIDYLYKAWRNKKTQTSTQYSLYADDTTTIDQKATVSDDGTTTTIGEVTTGP